MDKNNSFESIITVDNLRRAWNTVSAKHPAGGVDDVNVEEYAKLLNKRLDRLYKSLSEGIWMPSPYLNVDIPKKGGDMRTISLSVIEDKIVQTALKNAIEPILEHSFSNSSYAYRPGRGHLKCVRRAIDEMRRTDNTWFLHADIDNFFDSIDRSLLMKRLVTPIADERVRRLIEMCISMGGVAKDLSWQSSPLGIPQGATLSPLLANFYLTPFDQSVTFRRQSYVRYSDDFIIWTGSIDEAEEMSSKVSEFLASRLELTLNDEPKIKRVDEGVEFLGLHIGPSGASLTDNKMRELAETISGIEMSGKSLSRNYVKNIEGIRRYYLDALPEAYSVCFAKILDETIDGWRASDICPDEKIVNEIFLRLLGKGSRPTQSPKSLLNSEKPLKSSVNDVIRKRKAEYKKLEAENSEIVITSPGYYLGAGESGLILRKNGQPLKIRSAAVKHITISSPGVTFSSNLVDYCSKHGIGLTFMGRHNALTASMLSQRYLSTSLWNAQSSMSSESRREMAKRLILAKIGNQEKLCKYFNKYEKNRNCDDSLSPVLQSMEEIKRRVKEMPITGVSNDNGFNDTLMAYEAAFAELYWKQVGMLLYESGTEFYSRVKQGARDLVNSMLNYGYSLLYPRIWQSLLKHQLNPQIGFVHYADGNANLVFDFIELFRAQAVDRVVISMLRRREYCRINPDGLLDDKTKQNLAAHMMERLNRHETYRGNSRTLVEIIDLQAAEFAESIADGKTLRAYCAKW